MDLKHQVTNKIPDLRLIQDKPTRDAVEQFARMVTEAMTNIYDDLSSIKVDRDSALPTAGEDYLGKFYLKSNASAEDTLHVCIYDAGTSQYEWKQVTLT